MSVRGSTLFLCCLVVAALGCKADTRGSETKPGVTLASTGACALLSPSDIQAVQGEAVSDSQGSDRTNNAIVSSQCFYRLPTFNKSVSLEVMRPAAAAESERTVEAFWNRRFHNDQESEEGEAGDTEAKREAKQSVGDRKDGGRDEREREEEKIARPQAVTGLGDEAFWSGNQINGSLYVRKNNVIVRVSIGGPEDQSTKIKKTTALAEQILKRL